MSTPHNNANKGDIAKTVLMPGDPLRAQVIAEQFLQNVNQFNTVRNMFGYTGEYKGKKVSVMGSGMGIPSIGIYSYELYDQYDVDNIIRVGTAGGLRKNLKIGDVVFAQGACPDAVFMKQYDLHGGTFAPIASWNLLINAVSQAEKLNVGYTVGNILSSDIFYGSRNMDAWIDLGVLCVEMESAGLYANAAKLKKNALGLFTISDNIITGESSPAEQRQNSFTNMMKIALETAISL
jgi:purine-nucleoside phosphorylase